MSKTSVKQPPAQATPKAIVAVIRAFEQILADLRQGKAYQITRLTRLKRLCAEAEAATQFAAFVAQRSLQRLWNVSIQKGSRLNSGIATSRLRPKGLIAYCIVHPAPVVARPHMHS